MLEPQIGRGKEAEKKFSKVTKCLFFLLKKCYLYGCFACMYDYVPHTCLVPGQEKGLDPWELELQKVVGH